MPQLRISTFNLENLFSRYKVLDRWSGSSAVQITGVTSIDYQGNPLSDTTTQAQRNNTACAILDSKPDILAVQEIENLWTLRCFNDEYLGGYFEAMVLLEGNDPRGIDVGICVRHGCNATVSGIRTHIDEIHPADAKAKRVERYYNASRSEISVDHALFSRDCLEVDIDVSGRPLTFLVNHFKSQDGTKAADVLRNRQAARVAELVTQLRTKGRVPVVLGDLNEDWSAKTNLKPLKDLVANGILTDPFEGTHAWTHFYAVTQETSRLDYILLDGSLARAVTSSTILRKGITLKCTEAGDRYPTIGYVGTEASDHCPATVTLDL